jgi:cysteinyl-tRNA synthetase
MNITDVGHLTSDSDTGEDKMLKGAKREKKTVWEVAEFYTEAFLEDAKKSNIIPPTTLCKATEHIKEQIELVKKLQKKGFTYIAGGNVYFNTSKLRDYGKLAKLNLKAETKARVEKDTHKKNKHDFVLWFTKSKFLDQEMKWKSPWGFSGYPGWHVECSAMAMKYLGDRFDIHCGGQDLIPVHHTNEIAQAEAVIEKKPWVKYWLHNEFLVLSKGEKMAKSGNNFMTLDVLEKKGFDSLDFRYLCLGTNYRNPLMFSWEALDGSKVARKKLFDFVLDIKESKNKENKIEQKKYLNQFTKEINDDLNTPKALAIMWDVIKSSLNDRDKYSLLLQFDKVLGFNLGNLKKDKIPLAIVKLAKEREKVRSDKNWIKSDQLRDEINKKGYIIEDMAIGFGLKKLTD